MLLKNLNIGKVFPFAILLICLSYSTSLLDRTQLPRYVAMGVSCLTIFLMVNKKEKQSEQLHHAPVQLFIFFVLLSGVSAFWANTTSEAIFETCKQLLAFSVFLISVHYFREKKNNQHSLFLLACMLLVFAELIAVIFQWSYTNLNEKDSLYNLTGINSHKNLCSSFLFLLMFFLAIQIPCSDGKTKWLVSTMILVALCLIVLLRTKSVFMGAVAGLLAFGVFRISKHYSWRLNKWWYVLTVVILANIFLLLISPAVIEKVLKYNQTALMQKGTSTTQNRTIQTELDNERLLLWHKTYTVIHSFPLLGCGSGNWQIQYQQAGLGGLYRAEDLNYTFQRPHNDWLWVLSENGIIGFSLYAGFIVWLLLALLSYNKAEENEIGIQRRALAFAWICGYLVISFFDFPKERPEHLLLSNMLFGFAFAVSWDTKNFKTIKPVPAGLNRLLINLMPLLLIITIVIGIFRIKGEYFTYKMYHYKNGNNPYETIRTGKKAANFIYTIDPTSLPIDWYIGNAFAKQNQFKDALASFKSAYRLNPFNRNVLNDLGSAYMMNQQPDSAKHYYLKSTAISPRFDDPKLNLAAILIQEKNYSAADSVLKTLLHDSEKRSAYQNMLNAILSNK